MTDSLYSSDDEINLETNIPLFENDLNSGSVIRVLKPESEVGIESLPDQFVGRMLKHEKFSFNIMLLGQTGIGKSTLIDSLFKTIFTDDSTRSHSLSEVDVVSDYYDLEENGVHLRLGVIESKGFGDQITKDESYKPIIKYIDKQFDDYLEEELKTERTPHPTDRRIHACLYLISPVGHGLKAIDLLTMKKLDTKVNLIPVIAKSDLIMKSELTEFKAKIKSEIESNDINIYRFPTEDSSIDCRSDTRDTTLPFAVIASNEFVIIGDNSLRARQYPWGIVEVENESHCDFQCLREMVLRIHLNDLKESTHFRHYELYRSQRLEQIWRDRQVEHLNQLKAKERELIDNFTTKLKAKELELKKTEKDLHLRFEQLSKERIEEKMRLDLIRQRLEDDIRSLNSRKKLMFGPRNVGHESAERKLPPTPKTKNK